LVGGVVFALLYEYTGSLFAPFILHGAGNFILFSRII
jgi:membrane protease YdiL (CAAX protease family)